MQPNNLFDLLNTLQGDTLERAYALLRERTIAQRARARERQRGSLGCYLMLLVNRPPGARHSSVRGRVAESIVELNKWRRPSDVTLRALRLEAWPAEETLKGLVSDIFTRLNPDWNCEPQRLEHDDGVQFSSDTA